MTKQLTDILFGFTAASEDEKLDKIRDLRKNRNIERPAVAKKKHKKAKKKAASQKSKIESLMQDMSDEEKLAFLQNLKAMG